MSTLRFTPKTFARAFSSTPKPQVCRASIIGRIGTTPEASTTANGKELIKYTVGVNRGYGENQQTAWWRVAAFVDPSSRIGEKVLGLSKGTQVFIEGDMWLNKYEGGDGKTHSALSITQTRIEVLRRPDQRPEESSEGQE